jgi:cell division septal protein FtsQ
VKGTRPKRRRKSPAARIRPFWIVITFSVALLAVGGGFAVTWPGFDPKSIRVTGNHRVASSEILARAAIAPRTSMWFQSTGAMAKRIASIPDVESVKIRRIPPATIRISVTERVPYAVLRSGANDAVADRAMRVLLYDGEQTLPIFVLQPGVDLTPGTFVTSSDALSLRDAYGALLQRGFVPVQLALDRYGGLEVTLQTGPRLLLGNGSDLPKKLALASAILAQIVHGERRVAAIDVRAPASPVVVYR